jgi:hypothetical protein
MKIKILIVEDGEDADLKIVTDKITAEIGGQINKKIMQDVLNDYIEINTSLLNDLPPETHPVLQKYIGVMTKKFVINLITALKMSTVVGNEPLNTVETSMEYLSNNIAESRLKWMLMMKLLQKNTPQT